MPDFNFTISVPVHADMEPFKAEVRAGVEEATRGVSVPGSVAGGPAAGVPRGRASATFSPSEQAAVDRAMAHAQGPAILPRTSRGNANALAMLHAVNPSRRTPEISEAIAGLTGQSGSDAANEIRGRFSSLRDRTSALTTALATLPPPVPQQGTSRAWGSLRGNNILPTNSIRGLFGVLATSEINNVLGAVRGGDAAAGLAETPEAAFLARAQANEQATSGLLGGALALAPNLLDLPGSPQRMLREAQQAVTLRQTRDETRQRQNATAANVAFRTGYAGGGQTQAEIARINALRQGESAVLNSDILGLQARLTERTAVQVQAVGAYGTGGFSSLAAGGDLVLQGDARTTVQQQLKERTDRLADINAQAQFDKARTEERRVDFFRLSEQSTRRADRIAGGAGDSAIARGDIIDRFQNDRVDAVRQFGPAGGDAVGRGRTAALRAFDYGERIARENRARDRGFADSDVNTSNALATEIARLQTSGDDRSAGLADIRGRRDRDLTDSARQFGSELRDRNLSVGDRVGRLLPFLRRDAGILGRSQAEEGRFTEGFDRSEARTDRLLALSSRTTGLVADGREKTAVATQIEEQALIDVEGLRGPAASRRRNFILQAAVNREKSFLRGLELEGLQGGGQQVASGTTAGFTSQRPNQEPTINAIKEVKAAIERLTQALTGGE